jgi:translation initiation factor 2B subunit (eIF-2B alpha/beta/delta family)
MSLIVNRILSLIESDRSEGAASLALRGLDALEAAAPSLPPDPTAAGLELARLAARIDGLRPSIAAIGVQAVLAVVRARGLMAEGLSPAAAVVKAVAREREILGQANVSIAELARTELEEGGTLVTCSCSMTAQQCLVGLRPALVRIGEGHPVGDGLRAARWLSARGLAVEVVPDGALPALVRGARAALVGADQILAGGTLINRASTLSLALAARRFGVPFLVVCQRIKLAGAEFGEIEEPPGFLPEAEEGITGRAPLFDATPPDLIDGVLTEIGRLTAAEAGAVGARLAVLRAEMIAEARRLP